ncbi:CHAD domain-containing protein [Flavobacterium taihuense]|uniref:CHAD domain-containing protein n=1 Tax=Flavobacterium taihuense TaxID=2857508 RepID=A0ABS6XR22_9FLAO|nr:CHAD domain-containing protein [Flavobacterium taihuense]MBW4359126.1 CHAD domain-containing protein [Flavobacterium taihuense]
MKEDLLYHQVSDRLKSIEKHLCAYSKNGKPKHLHLLRLDIKVVKALFSFAEDIYNETYSVIALKAVFQKSGEIRDIQIISSSKHLPRKLICELKKKEIFLMKLLQKDIPKYIKTIESFRKEVTFPKALSDKEIIKAYFEKEMMKANQDFQNQDREGLHQFRKSIKKLMFVYNVLPKKIRKEIDLDEQYINKLQEKVGNWHDTYSSIEFLSYQYLKQKPIEYISKLKQKEIKQFNALFTNGGSAK